MRLDRRWRIVRDWIIRQIEGGEWGEDAKLPSIRKLSRMFDTSVTTVQRALADLEANAYIRAAPRIGYFVCAPSMSKPATEVDFSGITVDVNRAVVAMLSHAAHPETLPLSSAVLHSDLTPHALLNKCLSAVADKAGNTLAGLMPPPGLPALRRRIAGLMLARGVSCGPDDILITSGDSIALELALEAVAPKGATIAIELPTYYGILQAIERLSMRALPIRTCPERGIDVDHLAQAIRQKKVAAIFLNPTLQNPRGFIMPDENREQLSQLAAVAGIPIIEDDIFFDLVPQEMRPKAIKAYAAGRQTIYCSSFSKTVAPGYRVGWCVPGKYRDDILAQMFSRNLSVSSIAQNVLNEFIGRGYLEDQCSRLRSHFATLTDYVTMLVRTEFPEGTVYIPPAGGFIHWMELAPNTDMAALAAITSEQGCHIADSSIFFPDDRRTTGLRLCLGRALTARLMQNLKILALAAHQAKGAPASDKEHTPSGVSVS